MRLLRIARPEIVATCCLLLSVSGCKARDEASASSKAASPPVASTAAKTAPQVSNDAPPAEATGGFDGQKAYEHAVKQVSFGPRPSGTPAIAQTQDYILTQLKAFGCTVETDDFNANTPIGPVAMKNILVKIPGDRPGIILLGTHYDTLRMDNFVGADDGASSTGLMLELSRLLCAKRGRYTVWIAFFDGEEAMKNWSESDSRYGSREMAAKLSMSGDLKKIRAFLLADIVGGRNLSILRDSSSTRWLTDLVWSVAQRLGYQKAFLSQETSIEDDHDSFLKRNVPAVDVISDFANNGYWHTPQDTIDKISARSLAIVGHVLVESITELQSDRKSPPPSGLHP